MPPHPVTILSALESRLDYSLLHAARARRAARESDASAKLTLLRRLAQQTIFHTLPETRAEQSWNEQLFAKVLGYRTLLSHDALPFHILPKNAAGPHRFDDFSIGFFGLGDDAVLGTAELKSPGADLEARQTSGNYKGRTPVEQGISTAREHGHPCRWVLISNFRELRLYDVRTPQEPIAVVEDLGAIRNRDDLALLCAHFDAAALLGDPGKDNAEMSTLLDTDPIFRPLPAKDGHCRLVLRFVRKDSLTLPLFRIEKALREVLDAVSEHLSIPIGARNGRFVAKDGWVATESLPLIRLAASRFCEVQLSCAIPVPVQAVLFDGQPKTFKELDPAKLIEAAVIFATTTSAFHRSNFGASPLVGTVGGELREVMQVALVIKEMQEPMAPLSGICEAPEISAGDFDCTGSSLSSVASPLASCLCEFAIQFRDVRGGVGLSDHQARTYLERQLSKM